MLTPYEFAGLLIVVCCATAGLFYGCVYYFCAYSDCWRDHDPEICHYRMDLPRP